MYCKKRKNRKTIKIHGRKKDQTSMNCTLTYQLPCKGLNLPKNGL